MILMYHIHNVDIYVSVPCAASAASIPTIPECMPKFAPAQGATFKYATHNVRTGGGAPRGVRCMQGRMEAGPVAGERKENGPSCFIFTCAKRHSCPARRRPRQLCLWCKLTAVTPLKYVGAVRALAQQQVLMMMIALFPARLPAVPV